MGAVMAVDMDQVAYGIDGSHEGIYDGTIAWVMKDGTIVNRWAGVPGFERRAAAVERYLATAAELRAAGEAHDG
jgi:hypothetical protein